MAVNIFEKFGIKEVANVYFEALADNEAFGEQKGDIVLFLDTLKVSSIETTAENVAAQGGWGNPKLVMWDYGKEINLTLEDALLSLESARVMLGGKIKKIGGDQNNKVTVHYTALATVSAEGKLDLTNVENPSTKSAYKGEDTKATTVRYIDMTAGERGTLSAETATNEFTNAELANHELRIFWQVEKAAEPEDGSNTAVEITISPDTFPGTYKIVGDTFMKSASTGKDYPFQFVIPKAKVLSEVTLTMEAEGDPSTFEMQINVLRDDNGEMMKLIRYAESSVKAQDEGTENT
jgi:hypothetical protein